MPPANSKNRQEIRVEITEENGIYMYFPRSATPLLEVYCYNIYNGNNLIKRKMNTRSTKKLTATTLLWRQHCTVVVYFAFGAHYIISRLPITMYLV